MLLGLGFLSSRPVCLSVMLRLNTNSGQNEITEPELYRELASMANVKCGAGCANLNGSLLVCGKLLEVIIYCKFTLNGEVQAFKQ